MKNKITTTNHHNKIQKITKKDHKKTDHKNIKTKNKIGSARWGNSRSLSKVQTLIHPPSTGGFQHRGAVKSLPSRNPVYTTNGKRYQWTPWMIFTYPWGQQRACMMVVGCQLPDMLRESA